MATKVVPGRDTEFSEWVGHFVDTVAKRPGVFHLTEQDVEELVRENTDWLAGFREMIDCRDAAAAAVRRKDDLRQRLENLVRATVKRIQADNRVSDSPKAAAPTTWTKSAKTSNTGNCVRSASNSPRERLWRVAGGW